MRKPYITHEFLDLFLGVVMVELALFCLYAAFAANEKAPFLFRWVMLHGSVFCSGGAYITLFTLSGSRKREEAARKTKEAAHG